MRRWHIFLSALLGTALLAGCGVTQRRRADELTTTLNAYASTVRWVGWAQAAQFVDPHYRETHPLSDLDRARFAQVRVSEYDAGEGPMPVSDGEVRQVVRISLINRHTQVERTITDHQLWKYDAASHHWWLETGLPDISRGE